jgi:hypothetical protein
LKIKRKELEDDMKRISMEKDKMKEELLEREKNNEQHLREIMSLRASSYFLDQKIFKKNIIHLLNEFEGNMCFVGPKNQTVCLRLLG